MIEGHMAYLVNVDRLNFLETRRVRFLAARRVRFFLAARRVRRPPLYSMGDISLARLIASLELDSAGFSSTRPI